jgi:hypothetical protein
MIPYSGAPLPDLVDVLFFTDQWNEMTFHARADTTLANGYKVVLLVEQTGNIHRTNPQVQIVKVKK